MTEVEWLRVYHELGQELISAHESRAEACQVAFSAILRICEGAPHHARCSAVIDGPNPSMCDCHLSQIRRLCVAAT
jgi:hypothetical protein